MKFRKLKLGLQTLLTDKPKGYFIPYRYADGDIPAAKRGHYSGIERLFLKKKPDFIKILDGFNHSKEIFNSLNETPPTNPRWQQDWFPGLDGAAAFEIIKNEMPRHIIEIGSGHSTRFMNHAIETSNLKTKITSIDPAPRADISQLSHVHLFKTIVQNIDRNIFNKLKTGDILFIDSSHILMPGNDVDLLFNHIIPALPAGVIIHIHDMALPDDYPEHWQWRGYNEQLGVIPMLASGGFDPHSAGRFPAPVQNSHHPAQ